jgi:hypothetical protein
MAEESKLALVKAFFIFDLLYRNFSIDQVDQIHFGNVKLCSIEANLSARELFQNGVDIQDGVFF